MTSEKQPMEQPPNHFECPTCKALGDLVIDSCLACTGRGCGEWMIPGRDSFNFDCPAHNRARDLFDALVDRKCPLCRHQYPK